MAFPCRYGGECAGCGCCRKAPRHLGYAAGFISRPKDAPVSFGFLKEDTSLSGIPLQRIGWAYRGRMIPLYREEER